ncbi:MAG: hypothetical protein K8I02_01800, partial [Candidatus Methylomirabilis sp.]|nr:hypothetical protein [Deltaproteobacteria bacterium]
LDRLGYSGSILDDYDALLQKRIRQVQERSDQLWGNTVLPLQGMFMFQYKYTHVRTDERYDDKGRRGAPVKPVDVFGGKLDFGLKGKGIGHTFTMLYGITDTVAFFAEQPIGILMPDFNIKYTPPSNASPLDTASLLDGILPELYPDDFTESLQTLEGLYQAIELFGRPRPNEQDELHDFQLGDFVFGLGWNYYRSRYVSAVGGVKVTTPTGHVADENNALNFALGPEIDIGVGHWGFDLAHFLDWRLPEPFDFWNWTLELGYAYYFEAKRKSPTNFVAPKRFALRSQDNFVLASLLRSVLPPENIVPGDNPLDFTVTGSLIDVLTAVDPTIADQLAPVFPDFSNLSRTYKYRPGQQFRAQLQITPVLFGVIPTAFGVAYRFTEESEISANIPEFKTFVDAVELVAESELWSVWGKVTIPLLPLKLPIFISLGIELPIAGRNAFIYKDNFEVRAQVISPWFFPDWSD